MTAKYYTLLTEVGAAKLANATALGVPLKLTHMAVGDGGGTLPTPNSKQVALVGEKRRAALNSLSIDPQNASQIIAEQVIPESDGGWWVREIGLFDEAGDLIAVGNCPESYKPQLAEGSGRTQTVRMVIITSSTDSITLKIDPSVVLATRGYVDNLIETRQQKSDVLTTLSGLKMAKGKLPYFTGEKAAALADLSDFIRLMLNKNDATDVLEYLGLKGAAKCDVGTTAGTVAAGDDSRFGLMIGVGQTWQDVTGSRALSVTYTNSTSRPIMVFVSVTVNATSPSSILSVNDVSVSIAAGSSWPTNFIMRGVLVTIVPAGATYRVDGGYSLSNWSELR